MGVERDKKDTEKYRIFGTALLEARCYKSLFFVINLQQTADSHLHLMNMNMQMQTGYEIKRGEKWKSGKANA